MRQVRCTTAFAVVVTLAALASQAYVPIDEPSPKAAGTYIESQDAFQYVVAFYPPNIEGAIEPPFDTTAQAKYCAAADYWARRVHEATDGKHRIFRVHFYHSAIALPGNAGIHVSWHRQNGSPHVQVQGGVAGAFIYMYDNVKGCKIDWQVVDGMLENVGQFCDVPGAQCIDDGGPLGRLYCEAEGVPVERPASDWGWTLAHEASHWFYGLGDEYFNGAGDSYPNFKVCVGDPQSNAGTDETSMLAEWHHDHWCDDETHLQSLDFDGVVVDNPVNESMWTTVVPHWPELDGHVPGTYPDVDSEALPPVQCVFHFEVENDALIVLDRSGSMDYQAGGVGPTALDQAVEAALGVYNTTTIDQSSGVLGFNSQVTTLIPYEAFDGTPVDSIPVNPNGNTDLCEAIQTAAAAVRAEHPAEAHGSALLLSDGLPTVAGCLTDEDVLDAAWDACFGGEYPVSINTMAFGDADAELLYDVATLCNGDLYGMGQESSEVLPPPHELKIDISVAASAMRDRTRLLLERRTFVPPQQSETFDTPAGAAELEAVWLGDAHPTCDLSQVTFELISPSGTVYDAGSNSSVGTDEIAYHTRTVRVVNPEPGGWTARARESGASFVCGGARFGWLAHVKHKDLRAEATALPRVGPRNGPVRLTAALEFPRPNRGTPLVVAAEVARRGASFPLTMRDDGTSGDETASDGVYTAIFNDDGFLLEAGIYTLRVRLAASAALAQTVPSPAGFVETGINADAPARGAAKTQIDTTFVLRPCCDPDVEPPTPSAQCPVTNECSDGIVPGFESLAAGASYPGLSVFVAGQHVGRQGLRLGLGAGITVSNVSAAIEPSSGELRVEFDADVAIEAPDGPRDLSLRWGHKRLSRADAFDVVGDPAGAVPDGGFVPGAPLRLSLAPNGFVRLQWGASCASTDIDYAVYEGQLGDFESHVPRLCSTGGHEFATLDADSEDHYYLIVPLSLNREGSYGTDGAGRERAPSPDACRPQSLGACATMSASPMP